MLKKGEDPRKEIEITKKDWRKGKEEGVLANTATFYKEATEHSDRNSRISWTTRQYESNIDGAIGYSRSI